MSQPQETDSLKLPLLEDPQNPTANGKPPNCLVEKLRALVTQEDWCAVLIGLVAFVVSSLLAHAGLAPTELHKYYSNPFDAWSVTSAVTLLLTYVGMVMVMGATLWAMGRPVAAFLKVGIHVLFGLALLSKWTAAAHALSSVGLGAAVWSVLLGMLLGNTVFYRELPRWLQVQKPGGDPGCCDELFIKCNVVMLAVNVSSIIKMGLRGILVAWIDTPLLLLGMSYLGSKLPGISLHEAIIMGAATSICGTSAAVAAATVLGVGKDGYQPAVAIMSLMTVPAIPCIPLLCKALQLESAAAGAWIGGSVDTTGAVIASASISGDAETLRTAAIVKMEQNSILGLVCLALALWHARQSIEDGSNNNTKTKTSGCSMLWDRFPKFVLGFLIVSCLVSFVDANHTDASIAWLFYIGEWFGTLGFVAIGFNIRLARLVKQSSKSCSLFLLYVIGQTFDLASTLLLAWLAFSKA